MPRIWFAEFFKGLALRHVFMSACKISVCKILQKEVFILELFLQKPKFSFSNFLFQLQSTDLQNSFIESFNVQEFLSEIRVFYLQNSPKMSNSQIFRKQVSLLQNSAETSFFIVELYRNKLLYCKTLQKQASQFQIISSETKHLILSPTNKNQDFHSETIF